MPLGTYLYPFDAFVVSQTPANAPQVQTPDFGDVWIYSVEIIIPSGHRGLTGIYIANSGGQLVPYAQTQTFLVGDDDRLEYDIGVEFDSLLQIVTYNTDVYNHSFYLRFAGVPMALYNQQASSAPVAIVPVS